MLCPDCGHDNIPGEEVCADCGMPLAASESKGNEVERSISTHTVQVLCPHKPEFVQANATTREVVHHMGELRIGCVMVLDDDRFVGIFTERDVLNKITPDLSRLDRPVRDFMTANPAGGSAKMSATLSQAVVLLLRWAREIKRFNV